MIESAGQKEVQSSKISESEARSISWSALSTPLDLKENTAHRDINTCRTMLIKVSMSGNLQTPMKRVTLGISNDHGLWSF